MKKILAILICLCFAVLSFAACGNNTPLTSDGNSNKKSASLSNEDKPNGSSDGKETKSGEYASQFNSSESASVSQSADSGTISVSTQSSTQSANNSSGGPSEPQPSGAAFEAKDYLENGILYGDADFIAKAKGCGAREVATVSEIPLDAIFVSTNGNDSASGSIDKPLLTLQKALGIATAQIKKGGNGVIIMRGGTYSKTYFYSLAVGNNEHYVVITNYPGETVNISGNESTGLFHLGTSKYIIIEGLTFCDNNNTATSKAITGDGNGNNHIIIKNNEFKNITVSALKGQSNNGQIINFRGTNATTSHNNFLVYNNYIHDCVCGWSEAITFVGNCENVNIISNRIKNTGNIGIDIAGNWGDVRGSDKDQARNVVVRGNDVSGTNSPYARSYAFYVDGAKDVIFENNIAHDCFGGIEIGAENSTSYPVQNIIIRNNLVYNIHEFSVYSESNPVEGKCVAIGGYNPSEGAGLVKNVKFYNNTLILDNSNCDFMSVTYADNVEIKNNIFYSKQAGVPIFTSDIKSSYSTEVTYSNNLYYVVSGEITFRRGIDSSLISGLAAWTSATGEKNAKCANPCFTNPATYDFRLLTSSPAVNSGITVENTDYDLKGYNRVVGVIDIGCFEHQ